MALHAHIPDGPLPLPPPPSPKQPYTHDHWWPLVGSSSSSQHTAKVAHSSPGTSRFPPPRSTAAFLTKISSPGPGGAGVPIPVAPLGRIDLSSESTTKPRPITVGVLKETCHHERRVALTPQGVQQLVQAGLRVFVERGAGLASHYADHTYCDAGAAVVDQAEVMRCDLMATVHSPVELQAGCVHATPAGQCISLHGSNHAGAGFALSLASGRPSLTAALHRIAGEQAVRLAVTHYSLVTHGALPGRMVVYGATALGLRAAEVGVTFGMKVAVLDRDAGRMEAITACRALPVVVSHGDSNQRWRAAILSYCRSADVMVAASCPTGGLLDAAFVRCIRGPTVVVDPVGIFRVTQRERVTSVGNVTFIGYTDLAGLDRDCASGVYSAAMADFILALVTGRELAAAAASQRPPSAEPAMAQKLLGAHRAPLQPPPSAGLCAPPEAVLCAGLGAASLLLSFPSFPLLVLGVPAQLKLALAAVALGAYCLRQDSATASWPAQAEAAGRPLWTFLPVGFVAGLIGWMYGSYVCMVGFGTPTELVVFHLPFSMGLWSFVQAVSTPPGSVPTEWYTPSPLDVPPHLRRAGREVKSTGGARYCRRCHCFKPDRTHHDSNMDRCILRMDHHCPWINNTVGHRNHKYFLLFVAYMAVSSMYMCGTALPASRVALHQLLHPPGPPQLLPVAKAVNWLGAHTASGLFSASLVPFGYFHLRLATQNMTTIEYLEKREQLRTYTNGPRHLYDIGLRENLIALFGPEWFLWWIPIPSTPGDGVSFPTVLDVD
eukprot:GGOE01015048.1.p2 GENE.GGOE01015048.1~~GGOE01015048.1.p2  ORF type:complete len:776 (-),score=160.89 GGOE01015048.1:107-2434(-)